MNMIDDFCDEMAKVIDEKMFKFLNENGYPVEKPYTREKVLEVAERLKQDGKKLTHKVETKEIVFDKETNEYKAINEMVLKIERLDDEDR